MGLHIGFHRSRSTYDEPQIPVVGRVVVQHETRYVRDPEPVQPRPPNPDPWNWELKRWKRFGNMLLVEVVYPDCKNYEGRKIMLYRDATVGDLRRQKHLDPHFSSNKRFHSPFVRFEPTEEGWNLGLVVAEGMSGTTSSTMRP